MALNPGPWAFLLGGNCYQVSLAADAAGNVNGQLFASQGFVAPLPAAGVVNVAGNWNEGTQTLTLTFTLNAKLVPNPAGQPLATGGTQYTLVGVQFGASNVVGGIAFAGTFNWKQIAILGESQPPSNKLPGSPPSGSGSWIALPAIPVQSQS